MKTLIVRISEETASRLIAAVPGITGLKCNVLHSGDFGVRAGPVDKEIDGLLDLGLSFAELRRESENLEAMRQALRSQVSDRAADDVAGIFRQKARPAPEVRDGGEIEPYGYTSMGAPIVNGL